MTIHNKHKLSRDQTRCCPNCCPVHKHKLCGLIWATLFVSHLQSQGCVWTPDFFSAHTQNGQLADRQEIFTEFEMKCIGLELQTTPLTASSAPPADFNATNKIISPYRGALPARNLTHWTSNYVSLDSCQWRFLTWRASYPGSRLIWQDDMPGKSNTRPESFLTWSVVKGRDEEWLQDD